MKHDIQGALNQVLLGSARMQAAVYGIQNHYDDMAFERVPNADDLDRLRASAYNARILVEKMVEFMVGMERIIEQRMQEKVTEVSDG